MTRLRVMMNPGGVRDDEVDSGDDDDERYDMND